MIVKQVCAFIENKKGKLEQITRKLAENDIDISALSLADAYDYGVLRMIVNDSEKAQSVLRDFGVICKVTDVLAVAMDDKPGGFSGVIELLTSHGHEIKYIYACISRSHGNALMIFSVDDTHAAQKLIESSPHADVDPSTIYRI